jgi:hypothetical protein
VKSYVYGFGLRASMKEVMETLESIEAVADELRLGNKFVFVFCAR